VAALLAVAVVAIGLLVLSPAPVGVYFDDGVYAILGKSLAAGEGLRNLTLPGSPPATRFPPGYPLLLAGLWRLWPAFPENVAVFKFVNVALLGVAAAIACRFAIERLPVGRAVAILALLCGACGYPALFLAGSVLSETLFLALLVATLRAAEPLLEAPSIGRSVAVGALAGALALTRSIGVVVVPAVVLLLAWRRARVPALLVLVTSLAFLVPWQLWVAAHAGALPPELRGNYAPYGPWLARAVADHGPGFFLQVAPGNAAAVGAVLGPASWLPVPAALRAVIGGAAVVVLALGGVRAWRRAPVTVLSLVGYLLVVLVWPFAPERFVWGVWPLLVLLWVTGVVALVRWRPVRARWKPIRPVLLGGSLLVMAAHGLFFLRAVRGEEWWSMVPRLRAAAAAPVVRWVVTHTSPGDIVVTDHGLANLVSLYTGRKVLPAQDPQADWSLGEPPLTYHAYYLARLLQRWDVRYVVVVGSPALQAAVRLAGRPPERLALMERFPQGGAAFAVIAPVSGPGRAPAGTGATPGRGAGSGR
jgi:hypothetical protein